MLEGNAHIRIFSKTNLGGTLRNDRAVNAQKTVRMKNNVDKGLIADFVALGLGLVALAVLLGVVLAFM